MFTYFKKKQARKTVKIKNTKQEQQIDRMTKIVYNHGKTS